MCTSENQENENTGNYCTCKPAMKANPGNMKLASLEVTVVQNYNRPTNRLTGAGCRLYIVEPLCSTAKKRINDAFTTKGSTVQVGCQSPTEQLYQFHLKFSILSGLKYPKILGLGILYPED